MPQAIISYAANPNYALALPNPQAGAQVSLQPIQGTPFGQLLWQVNPLNGFITYANSSPGNTLVLATTSCNAQTPLTVQIQNTSDKKQLWNFIVGTTTISSVGCPGMCVDDQYRGTQPGTTIWLYPLNGSPAQQWIIQPVDSKDLA